MGVSEITSETLNMFYSWLRLFCLFMGHNLALPKKSSIRSVYDIILDEVILEGEATNPGPEMDTVYIPGTSGAAWTKEEVKYTRQRVLKMITPIWQEQFDMGIWSSQAGVTVNENKLLRLVFHDCIPYEDGTGGCDGCLNWTGMFDGYEYKGKKLLGSNVFKTPKYSMKPKNATNNQFLDAVVVNLEKIYKTIDWPFKTPSLDVSLYQSGKSRADLWQFAGLVALERLIERSNRACDLDYHQRQQVRLLEGREKCEIKLTKPLKFMTGRKDCITDRKRTYKTGKKENQPKIYSDGRELIDYGMSAFGMPPENWAALQAIHGATDWINSVATKYTWFGSGYLSNTYFKQIANKPMYNIHRGGDQTFTDCVDFNSDFDVKKGKLPLWFTFGNWTTGDLNGNPIANNGWNVHCWDVWNTTEGGPCDLRFASRNAWDAPNPHEEPDQFCLKRSWKAEGPCEITDDWWRTNCKNAYCDKNNILRGAKAGSLTTKRTVPWKDSTDAPKHIGITSWSFALPWEVGMYLDLKVGGLNKRAMGCPGLDTPFGSVVDDQYNWPEKRNSQTMKCGLNMYTPVDRPMHELIDELASDNELFAEKFLEGWQMMTSNGYFKVPPKGSVNHDLDTYLVDGPENGWFGYYSLSEQGVDIGSNFADYIEENKPVWFTDPKADPYLCGHKGHFAASCGNRFSFLIKSMKLGLGSCALNCGKYPPSHCEAKLSGLGREDQDKS